MPNLRIFQTWSSLSSNICAVRSFGLQDLGLQILDAFQGSNFGRLGDEIGLDFGNDPGNPRRS